MWFCTTVTINVAQTCQSVAKGFQRWTVRKGTTQQILSFLHTVYKRFQHSVAREYCSKIRFLFWLLRVTAIGV